MLAIKDFCQSAKQLKLSQLSRLLSKLKCNALRLKNLHLTKEIIINLPLFTPTLIIKNHLRNILNYFRMYIYRIGFLIDPKNHNRLIDRSYIFMIDQKSMNLIDHVQSTF